MKFFHSEILIIIIIINILGFTVEPSGGSILPIEISERLDEYWGKYKVNML